MAKPIEFEDVSTEESRMYGDYAAIHDVEQAKVMPAVYMYNSHRNYQRIRELTEIDRNIPDEGQSPDAGKPAIIIGSGASLDGALEALPELRDRHDARIFCAPSQMWALEHAGVRADYVVVHDPWAGTLDFISGDAPAIPGITPISSLTTWPGVLDWETFDQAGKFYQYITTPRWADSNKPVFKLDETQVIEIVPAWVYGSNNDEINHPITNALPYAPNTTFQAIALANFLGHAPIYLVGVDLCYWQGIPRHVTYMADGRTRPMIINSAITDETPRAIGSSGFRVIPELVSHKRTLMLYSALFSMQLVEVVVDDTPGNLEVFPRIGLEEFANGGSRNISVQQTAAACRDYVVSHGWNDQVIPRPETPAPSAPQVTLQ
jgi:hypothetical protein